MQAKMVINYSATVEGSNFTVYGTDKDIMEMMTIISSGVQVGGNFHIELSNSDTGDTVHASFHDCRGLKDRVNIMLDLIGSNL